MPALKYWDAGSNQYVLLMPGAPTTFPLIYTQTLSAPTVVSSPYQVNHNLGTTTPLVQAYDAVTGQLVMVAITVANSNSIQVSVSANMPNNINVVVVGTAQSPVPVSPADLANKSYVDARTPNLPAPITSGSGVQSFTDTLGDVWVAANGVNSGAWKRARDVLNGAYKRTATYNTNTTAGVFSTLFYDTPEPGSDKYGLYTNAGGGSALIPISGLWSVYESIAVTPTASGQWVHVNIFRNGATFAGGVQHVSNTTWWMGQASYIGPLTAGDTIGGAVAASVASLVGRTDGYNNRFSFAYLGTG
jgi:hypothetical protein